MPNLFAGATAFLAVLSSAGWSQSLSFSTDFDGTGTGSGFTIHIQRPVKINPPRPFVPRPRTNASTSSMNQYLERRYEEQRKAAEKAAREAELRRQADEAKRRNDMVQLQSLVEELQRQQNDEPNYEQRMKDTQKVLDLEKQFARAEQEYLDTLPSYRDRLAASLNHIVVPPPPHPLRYNRILIWGMFATPEEALRANKGACRDQIKEGCIDPFTGERFDEVFAFGRNDSSDADRVMWDHLLSTFDHLSERTSSQIGHLKGAYADEVVCHSNGCTIAEVLIDTGMLHTKRLRMLGGDTSLYEIPWLNDLAQRAKLEELSVYVIRGDWIPVADVGWEIVDTMKRIGNPLETFKNKVNDPLYQFLGLTDRPGYKPDSQVQVRTLTYPAESDSHVRDKHIYETYARVIKGWRMSGCLLPGGATNPHCMIYASE